MVSKRRLRRRQCERKAYHATAAGVVIATRNLHQKYGHRGQMSVYRCPHCGKYHIGHQPSRNGIGSGWRLTSEAIMFLECVPITVYCEMAGETLDAINKRLQRGVWQEGVQVLKVEGVKERWVDLIEVSKWARKNRDPFHSHVA